MDPSSTPWQWCDGYHRWSQYAYNVEATGSYRIWLRLLSVFPQNLCVTPQCHRTVFTQQLWLNLKLPHAPQVLCLVCRSFFQSTECRKCLKILSRAQHVYLDVVLRPCWNAANKDFDQQAGRQPTSSVDKLLSVDQSEQSQGRGWAGPQPVRSVECYDPAANRRAKRGVISTAVNLRPHWHGLYMFDL